MRVGVKERTRTAPLTAWSQSLRNASFGSEAVCQQTITSAAAN